MRFLILIWYTLGVIIVAALTLILLRVSIAELIALHVMESAGLGHTAIHIQQFDTHHLVIDSLDFTLATDSTESRVEVRDISIDYRVAQLAEGTLDQLSIEYLLLHQVNTNTVAKPAKSLDQNELLQLLSTDWRALIPINTVAINRIDLEGSGFGPLKHTAHRLQIQKTETAIVSQLRYLGVQSNSRLLTAKLANNTLDIDLLVTDNTEKPAFHSTIKPGTGEINIQWYLLPNELKAWLTPFTQIAHIGSGTAVSGALHLDFTTTNRINAKLDANANDYKFADYQIQQPVISLILSANLESPEIRIDILPGSIVRVADIKSDRLSLKNTAMSLLGNYTNTDDRWALDGKTTLSRLPITYAGSAFILKAIHSHGHADANGFTINTTFSPEQLPGKIKLDVSHSTSTASGIANLTMPQPIDLDGTDSHLGQLLVVWPFPFDLASGELKLDASAAWSGGSLQTIHAGIWLTNMGGHYNELLFSGLNFQHQFDLLPDIRSYRPSELSINYIDAGVSIENISALINIRPGDSGTLPRLIVNNLTGHLFDGDFTGDPFIYDLNVPVNTLTLQAHDIDLADVVATQQFGNIEISGRVDGIFPIEINKEGLFINNGSLHNVTSEGVIRYTPATGTAGLDQNQLTDITLKALRDFHYETLNAHANYVPDGTLTLNFELKGTGPLLQTTRPVHLNINTEQNLLSLLKSIRYVNGLNKGLDESVREMYQDRTAH